MEPPPLDTAWVEATRKKALLKLEKLDTDLKNYKGNSIKESIRRGHDDLGDHYLDCGDLSNALKCYSRARDYCTSAKHVINMCLNVIKVGWRAGGVGARREGHPLSTRTPAGQCLPAELVARAELRQQGRVDPGDRRGRPAPGGGRGSRRRCRPPASPLWPPLAAARGAGQPDTGHPHQAQVRRR